MFEIFRLKPHQPRTVNTIVVIAAITLSFQSKIQANPINNTHTMPIIMMIVILCICL